MSDSIINEPSIHEVFVKSNISFSSEDPPREEWSSLESASIELSPKMILFKEGKYQPGSGEICTKYIPMSDSSILRHPYYAYPSVVNPGILEALLEPEKRKSYPLDGQELYLQVCEEMKLIPVRYFHRGLLQHTIDLKYYGLSQPSIWAMCIALDVNPHVVRLDLTSNFLDDDACYHLGQLLGENMTITELVLSGCRINSSGTKRLVAKLHKRMMQVLDLSKNNIGDEGFKYLADQFVLGAIVKRLNLSYNDLGIESALVFAGVLEVNNKITHLDLSWNKFSTLKGTNDLLDKLGDSKVLVELNMSWNALKVNKVFTKLLSSRNLKLLDLSNNSLSGTAAKVISTSLLKARRLHTLDLSCNPLSPSDALKILTTLRKPTVKLLNLHIDNITVDLEFLKEKEEILQLPYRKNTKVSHGEVLHNYTVSLPDIRPLIMKRMDYLTQKGKKTKLDIALYFLQLRKSVDIVQPRDILRDLKLAGTPVDEDLVNQLIDTFPGPVIDKGTKTIKLDGIIDMIKRLWPDKKLPPTPPPQQAPVAVVKKGQKKFK
ncbi:leucine-rich repeat-containing protein 74A-like [Pieris rapae]|uniref:leucine-rich repeat-containing protein 74A-like n=1 Tax=Pieris rapae TaxID=64459 RepID=UPI001E27D6ED|nr:leucine-rich repeat-containing protein 74A-like [Pieris rapae]